MCSNCPSSPSVFDKFNKYKPLTVTHQYLYVVEFKFCHKKEAHFSKNNSPTRAEKDF